MPVQTVDHSRHPGCVLIVLQDGRQFEGELRSIMGRYEIGGVAFDGWEIAELEDVT